MMEANLSGDRLYESFRNTLNILRVRLALHSDIANASALANGFDNPMTS